MSRESDEERIPADVEVENVGLEMPATTIDKLQTCCDAGNDRDADLTQEQNSTPELDSEPVEIDESKEELEPNVKLDCKYKKFGCKATLVVQEMDDHLKGSEGIHLDLLTEDHERLQSKLVEVVDRLDTMESSMDSLPYKFSKVAKMLRYAEMCRAETRLRGIAQTLSNSRVGYMWYPELAETATVPGAGCKSNFYQSEPFDLANVCGPLRITVEVTNKAMVALYIVHPPCSEEEYEKRKQVVVVPCWLTLHSIHSKNDIVCKVTAELLKQMASSPGCELNRKTCSPESFLADPLTVTDSYDLECAGRFNSPTGFFKDISYGKWLIFKQFKDLYSTWKAVCREIRGGSLIDCTGALCSTIRYDPIECGTGPTTMGKISVYSRTDVEDPDGEMMAIGINLIDLPEVRHDLKYKPKTNRGKFAHIEHDRVTTVTLCWNFGKPRVQRSDHRCNSFVKRHYDREGDVWKINIGQGSCVNSCKEPEGKFTVESNYDPDSEMNVTKLWHVLKDKVTTGDIPAIRIECPHSNRWKGDPPKIDVLTSKEQESKVGEELKFLLKSDVTYVDRTGMHSIHTWTGRNECVSLIDKEWSELNDLRHKVKMLMESHYKLIKREENQSRVVEDLTLRMARLEDSVSLMRDTMG